MNLVCQTFKEWRVQARTLLLSDVDPTKIAWTENNLDLFQKSNELELSNLGNFQNSIGLPKPFFAMAEKVALHRDSRKWNLLYRLAWEMRYKKSLLSDSAHPLVHELATMEKQVRRDQHKMTAFVRFRKLIRSDSVEQYLAWYEPDHKIVEATASFFKKRFAELNWAIFSPEVAINWDTKNLLVRPGVFAKPAEISDGVEDLWRTYYGSIFNPARVKTKMMKSEMPIRFWKNLPEAKDIQRLLVEAPERSRAMVAQGKILNDNEEKVQLPGVINLENLREGVRTCRACELCQSGRPGIFSSGQNSAKFILVGEQPGDREDIEERPFVGPAGILLREVFQEIGAPIGDIYLTNAVKHFRFLAQSGRRLHKTPSLRHLKVCRTWLLQELAIMPEAKVICLGATAAQSVLGIATPVLTSRQTPRHSPYRKDPCFVTLHPSAILRAPTDELRTSYRQMLTEDLRIFFGT